MSSLFFLCELLAFALVAYWAFANDQLGAKGGFKGLLRMVDTQGKVAARANKRTPQWRRAERDKPARAETKAPAPRWAKRTDPAAKRRFG